jgi:hypothetical protein
MVDSSPSSSTLTQRFELLKKTFSSTSTHHHRRRSSSIIHSLHGENVHENENQIKSFKRHRRKFYYSTEQYKTIERAKSCMVTLESTYRQSLELNTTYLIGKTLEGQTILLPKQLIEQANVITITDDDDILQQEQINILPSIDYSDISDDDEGIEPLRKKGTFNSTKTAYTSQGNVVTCITGSFD